MWALIDVLCFQYRVQHIVRCSFCFCLLRRFSQFRHSQLFPDQNVYAPLDPNLDAFNNTVQAGLDWITQQAQSAQT